MEDENLLRQGSEIEALAAIYSEEFIVVNKPNQIYSIKFKKQNCRELIDIVLQVTFTPSYPKDGPPIYEIQAPWLKGRTRQELYNSLENTYLENIGEDIIFLWAENVREFLVNVKAEMDEITDPTKVKETCNDEVDLTQCPVIYHGETITDRKSTFQAHFARVANIHEVSVVRQSLMQHKKIAHATHNIVAYRLRNFHGNLIQDCDDDGETAAGGRLLHLLQILDVTNIIIIVSRWYGGIQLGPDRFKHINNAARNILQQEGFLSSSDSKK